MPYTAGMNFAASPTSPTRRLAEQALSRAAGAPLLPGNRIDLLIDAAVHFETWLAAIRGARQRVLLENYIIRDDEIGRAFRDALVERAKDGVTVAVVYDWIGCLGQSRASFWAPLRAAGGQVRTFNPPQLGQPFGWISRDHRKLLVVDGEVGFLSGVCISQKWLGDPARSIAPWRDTGVALHGPAVAELELAFAQSWSSIGEPLPEFPPVAIQPAGEVALRVIATQPSTAGMYRMDQLIAAMARRTLWLTDAYFVGVAPYVQALASAARDGVDVRLLVPGSSDIPVVAGMSRSGYRPLLKAGIRVFEWNGSMLHAKTAVADGQWARVGSSNLNLASWLGNQELDVAIEDATFAGKLAAQYEHDLLTFATAIAFQVLFVNKRLGVLPVTSDTDDKVIGVADHPVVRLAVTSSLGALSLIAQPLIAATPPNAGPFSPGLSIDIRIGFAVVARFATWNGAVAV